MSEEVTGSEEGVGEVGAVAGAEVVGEVVGEGVVEELEPVAGGKVYVGNLPEDASEADVRSAASAYGRVLKCWVARRPPGFAFVEFASAAEARCAVEQMNGGLVNGVRVKVELSKSLTRSPRPTLINLTNHGPTTQPSSHFPSTQPTNAHLNPHYSSTNGSMALAQLPRYPPAINYVPNPANANPYQASSFPFSYHYPPYGQGPPQVHYTSPQLYPAAATGATGATGASGTGPPPLFPSTNGQGGHYVYVPYAPGQAEGGEGAGREGGRSPASPSAAAASRKRLRRDPRAPSPSSLSSSSDSGLDDDRHQRPRRRKLRRFRK